MSIDYLYSIIDLYLRNETDTKKTALTIKKVEDNVEFNFDMNEKNSDQTNFMIPYDLYKEYLDSFINRYKQKLMIIDEKYKSNVNNTCQYYVLFKNGRSISFTGFSILEMNDIRNLLYNIEFDKEKIRIDGLNEEKEMAYKPRLTLQQAGFSSVATLIMALVFFADILVIGLWLFKVLIK